MHPAAEARIDQPGLAKAPADDPERSSGTCSRLCAQRHAEQPLKLRDRHPRVGVVHASPSPAPAAGGRLNGRSSTNTHSPRRQPDRLGAQLVDARRRLADADLAGDHDAVEQLRRAARAGSASCPTSSRSGPSRTPAARAARTASTIDGSGCAPANSRSISPSARSSPSSRPSSFSKVRLVDAALLEADQQLARRRVAAEGLRERRRVQALGLAEGAEGGEQVGRHHAAPVDQQAADRCRRSSPVPARRPDGVPALRRRLRPHGSNRSPSATSSACAASCSTPSPKCTR